MKKFVVVLLIIATFCYRTALTQDAEVVVPEEAEEEQSEADLEAELGATGDVEISESIVQLPTLPIDIDSGPAWECTPRMIYRNSCQICKCTRNRRLRCIRRNCAPA